MTSFPNTRVDNTASGDDADGLSPMTAAGTQPRSRPAPAPLRILVVGRRQSDVVAVVQTLDRLYGTQAQVLVSRDAHDALRQFSAQSPEVALVCDDLSEMDSVELIRRIAQLDPTAATFLVVSPGSEILAAEAIKMGAMDYVRRGELSGAHLARRLDQALGQVRRLRKRIESPRPRVRRDESDHLVRALSHDLSANFMLLDDSFRRLKASIDHPLPAGNSATELVRGASHVEACLRQSRRYLEDLQTLGRTGAVDMNPEPLSVASAVADVLYEQQHLLQRRNIQVDVAPGLPTVLCHESRLRQILTNLLRNAALHGCSTVGPRIEIGPAPPPTLPASSAENDAAGWVWIAVTDNGSGIPEARRGDVFLAGYRVPGTGAEGSGVGLAIVRRIVDYYGGRVLVDSRVSRGCSILFSLPRAAEMPRDASPADETPIRRRRRRPPSSENSPAQPEYA